MASLSRSGLAESVSLGGGLRRLREVVRSIEIVASSRSPAKLAKAYRGFPEVADVASSEEDVVAVRFLDGLTANLRIVPPEEFAAALLFFTGSRTHTIALRALARERGFRLDEKGLFDTRENRVPADSEAEIYGALGLAYIEPELREGRGEIEAAAAGRLPVLVSRQDLRGLFHVHTVASDGRDALETMVRAAKDAGYGYVAITDHSQSAGYAGGLTIDRMRAQREDVRALRRRLPEMRILHGAEADILADGSIDYGDDFLAELDLVVASVHTRFGLNRDEQTARLIRAVRNPRVAILGHPTGRLLLTRDGVSADMEAVIDAAAETRLRPRDQRLAPPHGPGLAARPPRGGARSDTRHRSRRAFHAGARVRALRPRHGPQGLGGGRGGAQHAGRRCGRRVAGAPARRPDPRISGPGVGIESPSRGSGAANLSSIRV